MNQKMDENLSFGESLSVGIRDMCVKTKSSVDGVELDSLEKKNSIEISCSDRENKGDIESQADEQRSSDEENRGFNELNGGCETRNIELRSSDVIVESPTVINPQGSIGSLGESSRIDQLSRESSHSVTNIAVVDPGIMVINQTSVSSEHRELGMKAAESGTSKPLVENKKASKAEKEYCVIDISHGAGDGKGCKESWDGEKVCRICHLNSDQLSESALDTSVQTTTVELIDLGCGCKDDLGIAHSHCAEAWFKLKGNRSCEICGQTAKNITGAGDNRFMAEWNEQTMIGNGSYSSETHGGCWRGQPFCNFLMACLVIAFVLPWFFRVNVF